MIPVIDVFAGPGGLNEGFNSVGGRPFGTALSIEMDPVACDTLRLRSVVRQIAGTEDYKHYLNFLRNGDEADLRRTASLRAAWADAEAEVLRHTLGPESRDLSDERIAAALRRHGVEGGEWILIGGPPCQAYSLVGRSRRRSDATFATDTKHVLYREYLHIVRKHRPTVFVMENVKGLLSARYQDESMYARIIEDFGQGNLYDIRSFVTRDPDPSGRDFVMRSELYGVPQRRHRVILMGVRRDASLPDHELLKLQPERSVKEVLTLPAIRSVLTREDSYRDWNAWRIKGIGRIDGSMAERLLLEGTFSHPVGGDFVPSNLAPHPDDPLLKWLERPQLEGFIQHKSRSHMGPDVERYAYLSELAATSRRQPGVLELPIDLLPNHENVRTTTTPFQDRFKVQVGDRPSGTVVSHLAKDGHHFIHHDPTQARSITVREAARLQTFPDDYFFRGPRTAQFHQVGNAVPPLLAQQLGTSLARMLGLVDTTGPEPGQSAVRAA